MWVVLHHWQDDDYKAIESGVHRVWVCPDEQTARDCAGRVLRQLVRARADDPDALEASDDAAVKTLHEQLFQGECIPGCTEWVSVMQSTPDA